MPTSPRSSSCARSSMRHGGSPHAHWLARRDRGLPAPGSIRCRQAVVSQLSQLQDAFQRYMLHGEADIRQQVVGTARVPVQTRLAIYGDGYILRLLEALQATFPALAALAGADFERIGSHYIRTHESQFFSIRYYGDQLPQFLASDPQYAAVPILAELARWEWAMATVFDATDRVPLKVGDLA